MSATMPPPNRPNPLDFKTFYSTVFLDEHRHPVNIALHVFGTLAGLAWLVLAPLAGSPWLILLFPVVHAVPGLVGHQLVERNAAVGDVRIMRQDFSPLWFIAGNHRMTWSLLTQGRLYRGRDH